MDDDTKVTAEALAWVANEAGYPSIEKYAEAGMSALTPAQRKNFNTMLDSISASNKTIKIGLFIGGSVGTIGAILQYGSKYPGVNIWMFTLMNLDCYSSQNRCHILQDSVFP